MAPRLCDPDCLPDPGRRDLRAPALVSGAEIPVVRLHRGLLQISGAEPRARTKTDAVRGAEMIIGVLTGAGGIVLGTWICHKIWGPRVYMAVGARLFTYGARLREERRERSR